MFSFRWNSSRIECRFRIAGKFKFSVEISSRSLNKDNSVLANLEEDLNVVELIDGLELEIFPSNSFATKLLRRDDQFRTDDIRLSARLVLNYYAKIPRQNMVEELNMLITSLSM